MLYVELPPVKVSLNESGFENVGKSAQSSTVGFTS